jgi:hypothetical protein
MERQFEHDPTQTAAGMNLAVLECDMGNRSGPEAHFEWPLRVMVPSMKIWNWRADAGIGAGSGR